VDEALGVRIKAPGNEKHGRNACNGLKGVGAACLEVLTLLNLIRPPTKGMPSSTGGALPWNVFVNTLRAMAAEATTKVANAINSERGSSCSPADMDAISTGMIV